jgi:RNA polymerase sigma-70 factor (ECF subfamily)
MGAMTIAPLRAGSDRGAGNPAGTPADDAASDAALAARVAAREPDAFETLMRRHNRRLFRVARAILRSDPDAEDALQDAYLAAYRAIGRFRGEARLSTWLTRIVVNQAYARLRKAGAATVIALPEVPDMSLDTTAPPLHLPAEAPDHAALRAELRRLLERHIDALPEQFRTAFVLREVEELSVEEAAAALGVPEATVRTRAHRARALLRTALAHEIDVATVDAFAFAGERCDRIVRGVLERLDDEAPG